MGRGTTVDSDALVEALEAFDGTLLVVAHDRHLLSEAVDEIWAVDEKGITVYKEGFAQYDAARRAARTASVRQEAAQTPASSSSSAPAVRPLPGTGLSREDLKKLKREQAEQRNALYKKLKPLQARYEEQEKVFEEHLARQEEVEGLLADPSVYADGARSTELLKEFHELQQRTEKELEALGELEAQISELEAQRAALSIDGGE